MKVIKHAIQAVFLCMVFVAQSLVACDVVWVVDSINSHHGYHEKIGGMPWPKNVDAFQSMVHKHNVGLVLTLTDEKLPDSFFEGLSDIARMHIPFSAGVRVIPALCKFIENTHDVFRRGQSVVVHCELGVARTGAALACWLISEKDMTREMAVSYLIGCHERFEGINSMFVRMFERKKTPSLPILILPAGSDFSS